MSRTYSIAAIPGDGIGIEVTEAAITVLEAVAKCGNFSIKTENLPWGSAFYKETGAFLPPDFITTLKRHDAVLFGSVGLPGTLQIPFWLACGFAILPIRDGN